MTRQPTPGLHENFAEEAAMSTEQLEDTLERTIALDVATMSPAMRDRYRAALAQAEQPVADIKGVDGQVLVAAREMDGAATEILPNLHLIRVFADDMTERNWADKADYIKQQVDRILSSLAHPPSKREAGENWQIEYEVVMKDGDFCASSTDLNDAMHYAAMYSDDGPVEIVEVRRRTLEASHE